MVTLMDLYNYYEEHRVEMETYFLPLHYRVEDLRYEFRWELSLPKDVHGVNHHYRHLVSVLIGHSELLSSSL